MVNKRESIRQRRKRTVGNSEDEVYSHAFFTIDEVALLLRVSKRTVYNLIYTGKLRASKITYHITIIQKEDFQNMLTDNTYSKQDASIFANKVKAKKEKENATIAKVKDDTVTLSSIPSNKGKGKSNPKKTNTTKSLKPSSDYQQSVRDTFIDSCDEEIYTMAEICRKFKYTYGRFYNFRMRYEIPCVKGQSTKCFPKSLVDKAMKEEESRLGKDLSEHWYSCFDIMRIYGLGKTQVRRFAHTHNVRIKIVHGNRNYYLKADWDAARKAAEATSSSTKAKRDIAVRVQF